MGKKDKSISNNAPAAAVNKGADGGVYFCSDDQVLHPVQEQVQMDHVTKPWTREAWERARPWVLEQRQKLEVAGWSVAAPARTELFVLKKTAPHGADTEDGYLYLRIPKKFIDFIRAGRSEEQPDTPHPDNEKQRKTKRIARRKADSYELNSPDIFRLRIDADNEDADREANVLLDVAEPLENITYLLMCLQPGLARLHANRKEVIQPGTHERDMRDEGEAPSIRHRALVAAAEAYLRILPPVFWLKRNEGELRKILLDDTFDATLEAAERVGHVRVVKDVQEKTWEEAIKVDESAKDKKKKKSKKAAAAAAPADEAVATVAAAA